MPCNIHGVTADHGCASFSASPVKELHQSRSRLASPFSLPERFLAAYADRPAPFGYDGLGEFVYRRTYSRVKADGSHETWPETVARVVAGTFRMQQRWMAEQELHWDEERAQDEAQDMYERIFSMKFLPPGRGLWAMGTALTEERHLFAALNNCAFVSTKDMASEPIKPFTFLMDASMLGVGVGFDTRGAGAFTVPGPATVDAVTFVVPDTREGWVEALGTVLRSHFCGIAPAAFDVSLVRPAGQPIRGFGGISSGPGNLLELLTSVDERLTAAAGQKVTTTLIVDLMNLIGKCVVSANVRRTAEIAFGDPEDEEYVNLKNYEKNPERAAYGWTSNNSVFAPLGMDYTKICEAVVRNGEPGFCWLDNMQKYDRMDGVVTNKDRRAMGGNPCLEQTLEPFEMCCLVETFPHNHQSFEDYQRTLQAAFLYAKTVTLGRTHWAETAAVMARNRRIGTSMSGIAQFVTSRGLHELQRWCEAGYAGLQLCDQRLSTRFAVPMSIKTTSIKPSGTVSLLAGATPGIHYPISRFYIRRVRLPANSDLLPSLVAAGLDVEPAVSCPDTSVVSFVVDAGEGIRNQADVSMWEQLSLAAFLQKHWADNQVSCTVSFDPEREGADLPRALDVFQYQLKGVSFLPLCPTGAFAQMPYEEISEAEYLQRKEGMKAIQYAKQLVACDPAPELFCDGDKCMMA